MTSSNLDKKTRAITILFPVELHERLREARFIHRQTAKDIVLRATTLELDRLERETQNARKQGMA